MIGISAPPPYRNSAAYIFTKKEQGRSPASNAGSFSLFYLLNFFLFSNVILGNIPRKINNPSLPKKSRIDHLGIKNLIGWKIADIEATPAPYEYPDVNLTLGFIPGKTQKRLGNGQHNTVESGTYKACYCTLALSRGWSVMGGGDNKFYMADTSLGLDFIEEYKRRLQRLKGLTVKDVQVIQDELLLAVYIYFTEDFRMDVLMWPYDIQESKLIAPLIFRSFFSNKIN